MSCGFFQADRKADQPVVNASVALGLRHGSCVSIMISCRRVLIYLLYNLIHQVSMISSLFPMQDILDFVA